MLKLFGDRDWELLGKRIKDKTCTPFLGAGVSYRVLPLGRDIAQQWAKQYDFPLENSSDLTSVAQYLALNWDPLFPKEELLKMFKGKSPDFSDPEEPHNFLADLNLPLYLTTNYDNFMAQALKVRKERDSQQALCKWNKLLTDIPSPLETGFTPTVAQPVVFHLHGHAPVAESLVLTEDDYMDFLVNISVGEELLPPVVQKALTGTSLLFVGYRIADTNFRVLLRSLLRFMEQGVRRTQYAVMLPPAGSAEVRQKAQDYLTAYYDQIDVRVFWGDAAAFFTELNERAKAFA